MRTELQIKRDNRNKRIYQEYRDIMIAMLPNSTKWAVFRALGRKYGLKTQSIRAIVEKMENK